MSWVIFLTGKLGNGKTLAAVGKMIDTLNQGNMVASNVDLNLLKICKSHNNKTVRVIRLPDQPTEFDLNCLPVANSSYDDDKNGLLVLDECGTWFNARTWNEKHRQGINAWFLHARKLGWNVIFIVQDIEIIDSQARKALGELTGFCKDTSKIAVPVLSFWWKLFSGKPLTFPKGHIAKIVNGTHPQTDPLYDRWIYKGTQYYDYYDTKQCFSPYYDKGTYSVLTPWHIRGRYVIPKGHEAMRLTKIIWRKYSRPFVAFAALSLGSAVSFGTMLATQTPEQVKIAELERKIALLEHPPQAETEEPGEQKIDLLQGLFLSGFTSSPEATTYYFHHEVLGDMTSQDALFQDYRIDQISTCQVNLVINEKITTISCPTRSLITQAEKPEKPVKF